MRSVSQASFGVIDEVTTANEVAMPYRIVPVGDKLVMLFDGELRHPDTGSEIPSSNGTGANYYDFDGENAGTHEGYELTGGGNSHE